MDTPVIGTRFNELLSHGQQERAANDAPVPDIGA
jgi:hypothetical protein